MTYSYFLNDLTNVIIDYSRKKSKYKKTVADKLTKAEAYRLSARFFGFCQFK